MEITLKPVLPCSEPGKRIRRFMSLVTGSSTWAAAPTRTVSLTHCSKGLLAFGVGDVLQTVVLQDELPAVLAGAVRPQCLLQEEVLSVVQLGEGRVLLPGLLET